ncbi:MAG: hypothetical protein JNM93_08985 [Bacteriovoracaceae bacterium]|nr:hypothetical protein [Bacteriovoracaceae bacterium]
MIKLSFLDFQDPEKKVDNIVISVAAFFLFVSGLLILDDKILFQNIMAKKRQQQENPVATLYDPENDVRKKLPSDLVWIPASSEQRVTENETIFTGKNSSVVVKFDDGSTFTIEPDSMVVISKKDANASIDIASGGISGKLGKNVKLKTVGNDDFELSSEEGAEINLNMKDGQAAKVDVLSGNANFNTADGSQNVGQNQTVEMSGNNIGNVSKHTVKLSSPSINDEIILSPKEKIQYNWTPLVEADSYLFEFASDRYFKEMYFSYKTTKTEFETPRPKKSGNYFWKIKVIKNNIIVGESISHKFSVILEEPPQLILPEGNTDLYYPYLFDYIEDLSKASFDINFKWVFNIKDSGFDFELAHDKKFTDIVVQEKVPQTFINHALAPGEYHWRIKLDDRKGKERTWSQIGKFRILLKKSDETIKLLQPQKNEIFKLFDNTVKVKFEWENNPTFTDYQIEISANKVFKQEELVLLQLTKNHTFEWETDEKKTFYWRVRGINLKGVINEYTEAIPFKVDDPPPPAPPKLKNDKLEQKFTFNKFINFFLDLILPSAYGADATTEVTLEWETVERARKYRLEIGPDKKFNKNIVDMVIEDTKFVWEHDSVGTYYWRVRAIDKKGMEGVASEPGSIKLFFATPVADTSRNYEVELNEENKKTLSEYITLSWKPSKYAKTYQIELADNLQFQHANKLKSEKDEIELELFINKNFYWRVRAIDKMGRIASHYSEPAEVIIKPIIDDLKPKVHSFENKRRYKYTEDIKPAIMMNWDSINYVDEYELQVSHDDDFDEIKFETKVLKNQYGYVAAPSYLKTFYWRVRGSNKYSKTKWSETYEFNILSNENLPPPTPIYPSKNTFLGQNQDVDVYFQWTANEDALSYYIIIAEDENFKYGRQVYLASNNRAVLKLKNKKNYYYQLVTSFDFPKDENVTAVKELPAKGHGVPSKIYQFTLNKGYQYEIELTMGASTNTFKNDFTSTNASIVEGEAKGSALNVSLAYTHWPKFLAGNFGYGLSYRRNDGNFVFYDATNDAHGEFKFNNEVARFFFNYRTTITNRTSLFMNFGPALNRFSYPILSGANYLTERTSHVYYMHDISFRWNRQGNLYDIIGLEFLKNVTNSEDGMSYGGWYERRFYKQIYWLGIKMKYSLTNLGYAFNDSLTTEESSKISEFSLNFSVGAGF